MQEAELTQMHSRKMIELQYDTETTNTEKANLESKPMQKKNRNLFL